MNLFVIAALILAVLKLCGVVAVSWTAVAIIGLIPLAVFLVFAVGALLGLALFAHSR